MAITVTEITAVTAYDNTDKTADPAVYSTPTLTASADKLYLIFIFGLYASGLTPDAIASVAGGGLGTWTQVLQTTATSGSPERTYGVFRASSASPGAGAAIDITFGNVDMIGCGYHVYEITGHNTATPTGQTNTVSGASSATAIPTLASATAGSAILAAAYHGVNETTALEAGWTEGEEFAAASPNYGGSSAYRIAVDDLSCTFTWATAWSYSGVSVEVLAASGTVYTSTVSGSVTPSGVIIRKPLKALSGAVTPSGAIIRKIFKFFGGTLTSSGIAGKGFYVIVSGALTSAGGITRKTLKALAGTLSFVGTLSRGFGDGLFAMIVMATKSIKVGISTTKSATIRKNENSASIGLKE